MHVTCSRLIRIHNISFVSLCTASKYQLSSLVCFYIDFIQLVTRLCTVNAYNCLFEHVYVCNVNVYCILLFGSRGILK